MKKEDEFLKNINEVTKIIKSKTNSKKEFLSYCKREFTISNDDTFLKVYWSKQ